MLNRVTQIERFDAGDTTVTRKLVFDELTQEMLEEHVTLSTVSAPPRLEIVEPGVEHCFPERAR